MGDILFETDGGVFSHRVAGVMCRGGRVFLQRASDGSGSAFPGGHVLLGETGAQALRREFMEEMGAQVTVGRLIWVGEIYFTMKDKPCHQICFYYEVADCADLPDEPFSGVDTPLDRRRDIEFYWQDIALSGVKIYPPNAPALLASASDGIIHFIDRED